MTKVELENFLEDVDIMLRPTVIFCNPEDAKVLRQNFEKDYLIKAVPYIESGQVYCADRKALKDSLQVKIEL